MARTERCERRGKLNKPIRDAGLPAFAMNQRRFPRAAGFSLIELLVAMAIGLVLTLAIASVLVRTEGSKRSTTSINDINQSGAYATYLLDRYLRPAGSGYSQSWQTTFGCLLNASVGGTAVLPLPSAKPVSPSLAFSKVNFPMRLAPLIIGKDMADTATETRGDVLRVMSGTSGVGENAQAVKPGSVTTDEVSLPTALGYATNDLVLFADNSVSSCLVSQVGTHAYTLATPKLPLSGTYYRDPSVFGADSIALQLGRYDDNLPQFLLIGVGDNNILFSYDLLKKEPPDATITDSVVEMRALYGLDNKPVGPSGVSLPDGVADEWVDATGDFDAAKLMNGSAASRQNLRQIVAVRVGLILRTSLAERSKASAPSGVTDAETTEQGNAKTLTLFADQPTALQKIRTLTVAERAYRFRTVEVTIPLRNVLMAPNS
jgi:type IV pilus assembly protein PilW